MRGNFGWALASALSFGFCSFGGAMAADLPLKAPPPVVAAEYNWSGIYVGVNGGGAQEHMFWAYDPPIAGNPRQTNAFDWSQGAWGTHIGGQWQTGHFVFGAEAGYIWNQSGWQGFSCPNPALVCQARMGDLWTAGGRLGYAWNRFMLYGTGGYARGSISTQVGPTLGQGVTEFSNQQQDGWFGGIGAEYAVWTSKTADLILGAEWTHVALNQALHCVNVPGVGCTFPSSLNRDMDGHTDIFRVRASIKFNPWQSALVAKY